MIFNRPEASYDLSKELVEQVLEDSLSPLSCIARQIPSGSAVLDIGAGNGLFASILKCESPGSVIDGIEPNIYASSIAKSAYRNFWNGYLEDVFEEVKSKKYDFIVIADVIEHLPDPYEFLCIVKRLIDSGSSIYMSIPNIAFGAVRLSLLNGHFMYVDSGLLEKTHLRFYTLETIKSTLGLLGIHISKIIFLNRSFFRCEIPLNKMSSSFFTLFRILLDETSRPYQYVLLLDKNNCPEINLVKIGVPAISIVLDKYIILIKNIFKKISPNFFVKIKKIKNSLR
ncbi:class I SAM-dependent methyltransferase [Polynucleobacter paneuropaeus]|nr:class I SAM-dependent methyltransferase [Polynucleobacter paneuropaeus]